MAKTERELTIPERRSIRKLVTGNCANYDKEYGCLPLDCECPMLGICYTNSAMCRYFRKSVLPNDIGSSPAGSAHKTLPALRKALPGQWAEGVLLRQMRRRCPKSALCWAVSLGAI